MLSRLLFSLSKQPLFGYLVRFGFQYASILIPVKKILNNAQVVAFFHPKPAYKHHILIVPKQSIRTPLHLPEDKNVQYAVSILSATSEIVDFHNRLQGNYILGMNGGPKQEVPQIHFHLYINQGDVNELGKLKPQKLITSGEAVKIFHHPNPNWEIHVIIIPNCDITLATQFSLEQEVSIKEVFKLITNLDRTFNLAEKGYTIYIQEEHCTKTSKLLFHVVAGKKVGSISH
jgi:diadenosine tetraphosphate (Ap4A) HIT family hydrolase